MRDDPHLAHLVRLFGSPSGLARAAGVNKAAVFRWPPANGIGPRYQIRILEAAHKQGLPIGEVLWGLNPQRCTCCEEIVDNAVRDLVNRLEVINAAA